MEERWWLVQLVRHLLVSRYRYFWLPGFLPLALSLLVPHAAFLCSGKPRPSSSSSGNGTGVYSNAAIFALSPRYGRAGVAGSLVSVSNAIWVMGQGPVNRIQCN